MLITEYDRVSELLKDNVFLLDGQTGTKSIEAKPLIQALLKLVNTKEFLTNFDLRQIDQKDALAENDRILIGTTEGNQAISVKDFYFALLDESSINCWHRNCIVRGKNLGDHVTDEQWANIKDGSFKGMFLADYWEIDGRKYRIIEFNYWKNTRTGTTHNPQYDKDYNHIAISADGLIGTSVAFNTSTPFTNGYVGSTIRSDTIPNVIKPVIRNVFGSEHIYEYNDILVSANQTTGIINSTVDILCDVEIPNTMMVLGNFAPCETDYQSKGGSGICNHQAALYAINVVTFAICPGAGDTFWFRDIASASSVYGIGVGGNFAKLTMTGRYYPKVVFGICQKD